MINDHLLITKAHLTTRVSRHIDPGKADQIVICRAPSLSFGVEDYHGCSQFINDHSHLHRNICCFAFKLDFGSSLSSSPSLNKIITMMRMTTMTMIMMMMKRRRRRRRMKRRRRRIPCQVKVEGGVVLFVHNVVDAATHFYHYQIMPDSGFSRSAHSR